MNNLKDKYEKVCKYFDNLSTIKAYNNYPYVLFPLTDYNPPVQPELFDDFTDLMIDTVSKTGMLKNADLLVSQADRGCGPLTYELAKKLDKPFTLANWYPRETAAQIQVESAGNRSGPGFICLNGIKKNDKVVIVADLISTGGTTLSLAQAVLKAGAKILGIVAAAENIDYNGVLKIEKFIEVRPFSVLKYKVVDGRTHVIS